MTRPSPLCRCWLSLVHVIALLAGGFAGIWILLHNGGEGSCLRSTSSVNLLSKDNVSTTCTVMLSTTLVVMIWSLSSIIFVICCVMPKLLLAFQIILSALFGLLCAALASVTTISFVEWCDSLRNCTYNPSCPSLSSCFDPASIQPTIFHNSKEWSDYLNELIELVSMWILVPSLLLLALNYSCSLCACQEDEPDPTLISARRLDHGLEEETIPPVYSQHAPGHATNLPRYEHHNPPPYHRNSETTPLLAETTS